MDPVESGGFHSRPGLDTTSHGVGASARVGAAYEGETDEITFLDVPHLLSQAVFNEFVVARSSSVAQTSTLLSAPTLSPEQARTLRGREAYGVERHRYGYTL